MADKVYPVCTLSRATIVLGRQLDNRVRRIVFDVTSWLQEYPEGTITLYVIPPEGDGYPVKIDMDNGKAIWTILESDTAYSGRGMAQLQLIGKNGEKLHSANANTLVEPSAAANAGSTPPNAAKPWFDDVQERLKRIEEAGGVTDEQVAGALESYLEKNPDAAGAKIDDAKASEKTTYSSKKIEAELTKQKEAIDNKVGTDELNAAVKDALTEAKNSGEFKGDPGEPGYTPQKGIDYFDGAPGAPGEPGKDYVLTDADKQEIAAKVPVPNALPNPFPLTINGTTYDGSKAVDVTVEGGSGSGSESVNVVFNKLFDTGIQTFPTGTTAVETGLTLDDLMPYDEIVFQEQTNGEPWTGMSCQIKVGEDVDAWGLSLAEAINAGHVNTFIFQRLKAGENHFRVIAESRNSNGNIVGAPPATNGNYTMDKVAVGYSSPMLHTGASYMDKPIFFDFSTLTEDRILRFSVSGVTKAGDA